MDTRGDRTDVAAFWREYRDQFDHLSTTFFDAVEGSDQAALAWTSEATLTNGRPISYRGVTVLDLEGDSSGPRATVARLLTDHRRPS